MTRRGLLFGLSVLLCAVVIAMVSMPQRACSQEPIFNPLIFPIIKEVRGKFKEWRAEHKYNPRKLVNAVKEGAKKLEETTALLPVGDQVGLFSIFFEEASKTLDIKEFCRLYFQYRGDEKSKFNRTEFSEKWASDEYYEQNCLKKKKEPSDQALAPCGEGERTIAETAKGNYTIELLGDGTTTDQTVVAVTNNDTGAFGATTVKTMCSSTRTHKPPPYRDVGFKEGLTYSVAAANPAHVAILKAADKLASEGKFSKLGLHNAKEQVAQNAIWTVEGEKTGKPEHQVTNDSIKSRILKQVDPEKVTPEVDQALTTRVDEILACVNLTIKESKPLIQDPPPKKPEDDTVTPPPPETGDDSCEPGEGPDGFCIPPYTAFKPCDDAYQEILTTESGDISLCGTTTGSTTVAGEPTSGDDEDEPGDGIAVAPPEDPGIGETPETGIKYGILLIRDDDKWIPKNPDRTSATAQIYEKKPTSAWVPSKAKKVITFEFKERSNERGDCLNHDRDTFPDLFFSATENPTLTCTDDPSGENLYFGSAVTKLPASQKTVMIASRDWGAFSKVTASAPGCIPLRKDCITSTPLLDYTKVIVAVPIGNTLISPNPADVSEERRSINHRYGPIQESDSNEVSIPKDDNDNQIADAWEYEHGIFPASAEDFDPIPRGNGVKGDGLSCYEEYRGFFVSELSFEESPQHVRTNWLLKNLFIEDTTGEGFAEYEVASGFDCWPISKRQYDSERVVNFNRGHSSIVKQHGLCVIDRLLDTFVAGDTRIGPPRNVKDGVIIDLTKKREYSVTHELGHATGANHHAKYGPDMEENYTEYEEVYSTTDTSREAKAAKYKYPGTSIGYVRLPNFFFFAKVPNNHSGDISCFMNYVPLGGTLYVINGKFELARGAKKRDHFCVSGKGTGENADGHCAGDAQKGYGNCAGQLIVNDAGESNWE